MKKGFTLIEALIVLIIISILVAISAVAFSGYIDSANRKTAIAECRDVLTSAQTIAAELYAEKDLTNSTLSQKKPQILSLADSGGYIAELNIKADINSAKIAHINYWNTARTLKVIYDADAAERFSVCPLSRAEGSYDNLVLLYKNNYSGGDVLATTQYLRNEVGNFFELTDEEKALVADGAKLGWRAFASDDGVYFAATQSANSLYASLIYYNGNYYYHYFRYGGSGSGVKNAFTLSDRGSGLDLSMLDNAMNTTELNSWLSANSGAFDGWVMVE